MSSPGLKPEKRFSAARIKTFFRGISRTLSQNDFLDRSISRRGTKHGDDEHSYGKESSSRSIMFDLELSGKGSRKGSRRGSRRGSNRGFFSHKVLQDDPKSASLPNDVTHRAQYLARPVASFEIDLLQDVHALCSGLKELHGNVPLLLLAADLTSMGYKCSVQCVESPGMGDVSNYNDSSNSTKCLELLKHEFLICEGKVDGSSDHQCLIDPNFRDQFLLGKHSKDYDMLLEVVPQEFVGSTIRLQALAAVICSEMAKVYQELGISLPPWRRPNAVLGKWFDTSVLATPIPSNPTTKPVASDMKKKANAGIFNKLNLDRLQRKNKSQKHDISLEKSNKPQRRRPQPVRFSGKEGPNSTTRGSLNSSASSSDILLNTMVGSDKRVPDAREGSLAVSLLAQSLKHVTLEPSSV